MFAEQTVFVVGAGASVEAGLPTGEGLIPKIVEYLGHLRGEAGEDIRYAPMLDESKGDRRFNTTMMEAAAKRITKGLHGSFSIDNFIDENRGDKFIETVGKLAIAKTILAEEATSKMHEENINGEPELASLRGTWYSKLSSLIFEGCTKEELAERLCRITFVIFNYDRCLEHYLFWMIRFTYGVTQQDAAAFIGKLTIYHPYGSVGLLPWQDHQAPVHFGNPRNWEANVWSVAARIKTFTEGIGSDENAAIRRAIFDANMVIFLGFGFHHLNMSLLTFTGSPPPTFQAGSKRYFGTVLGRSKSDQEVIRAKIESLCRVTGQSHIELASVKCAPLFDEFYSTFASERYV